MTNSRTDAEYRQEVVVDTAPGAAGYFTNAINPRQLGKKLGTHEVYFSIRGDEGVMTVTLQFLRNDETDWEDYATYDNPGAVVTLPEKRAGFRWRAGVKFGDFTSGEFTIGFNF